MKKILLLLFLIPNLVMAEDMEWESYCNLMADVHNVMKDKINQDMASRGGKVSIKKFSCDSSDQKLIAKYSLHKKYFKYTYKKKFLAKLDEGAKRQMSDFFCGMVRANNLSSKDKDLFAANILKAREGLPGLIAAMKIRTLLDIDLSDSFYQVKIYRRNKILIDFTNAFGDCSLSLTSADKEFLREKGLK
jgi:hypothetical protein